MVDEALGEHQVDLSGPQAVFDVETLLVETAPTVPEPNPENARNMLLAAIRTKTLVRFDVSVREGNVYAVIP